MSHKKYDINWFKESIEAKVIKYEIKYESFKKEGDFGFLSRVEINSLSKVGVLEFWSSGCLSIQLMELSTSEYLINIFFTPERLSEVDDAINKFISLL